MNVAIIASARGVPRLVLAVLLMLPGASALGAIQQTCLKDDGRKVCMSVNSTPESAVQPSGAGGSATYAEYRAVISNMTDQSTRKVEARFDFSPAVSYSYRAQGKGICQKKNATLICLFDKLVAGEPEVVTILAQAPAATTTLVTSGTIGWEGREAKLSHQLPVDPSAGRSFVPPRTDLLSADSLTASASDTSVTLVTAPENSDPTQQVTSALPLWAKIVVPMMDEGYEASLTIIHDGPDFSSKCDHGFYYSEEDGGPYVCRDPNNPQRWVEVDLGYTLDADNPFEFTMMWDSTIVPTSQLMPSLGSTTTGTPAFAIFHGKNTADTPIRAFADVCDVNPAPPCLTSVEAFSTGDWRASGYKTNDGSDLEDQSGGLLAVLNFLIPLAAAQSPDPPVVLK